MVEGAMIARPVAVLANKKRSRRYAGRHRDHPFKQPHLHHSQDGAPRKG